MFYKVKGILVSAEEEKRLVNTCVLAKGGWLEVGGSFVGSLFTIVCGPLCSHMRVACAWLT